MPDLENQECWVKKLFDCMPTLLTHTALISISCSQPPKRSLGCRTLFKFIFQLVILEHNIRFSIRTIITALFLIAGILHVTIINSWEEVTLNRLNVTRRCVNTSSSTYNHTHFLLLVFELASDFHAQADLLSSDLGEPRSVHLYARLHCGVGRSTEYIHSTSSRACQYCSVTIGNTALLGGHTLKPH